MVSNIKFTVIKFHNSKIFGLFKCLVYIKISWIGYCSQFFADKIIFAVMHCLNSTVVCTIFTTGSGFSFMSKYILPTIQQNLVFIASNANEMLTAWVKRYNGKVGGLPKMFRVLFIDMHQ